MSALLRNYRSIAVLWWFLVALAAGLLVGLGNSIFGWDLHVYTNAIHSMALGHDPYADGTAVQRLFHATPDALNPTIMPPYTYVYSPITLPLLRAAGMLPEMVSFGLYWALYALGVVSIAWACLFAAEPRERPAFVLLAAITPFFPGLLQNDVILSGNLVYIVYGGVLSAAVLGWRRGLWLPFYIAVFIASCFKAPLLTLVVIPLLSARKQWLAAAITSVAGLGVFALQAILWPSLFHSYLDAVELQFSFNHDFGFSPAGMLGDVLYYFHIPYSTASTAFYCVYAAVILATLFYFARLYFEGAFTLERWIPVMLVGVILLNPRVKEYDVAPLTIPMCMLVWRLLSYRITAGRALFEAFLVGAVINLFVSGIGYSWKPTEGTMLIVLFVAGAWQLLRGQTPALTPFLVQTNTRPAQ